MNEPTNINDLQQRLIDKFNGKPELKDYSVADILNEEAQDFFRHLEFEPGNLLDLLTIKDLLERVLNHVNDEISDATHELMIQKHS